MKEGHKKALVVAYYISKYNDKAYEKLGFGSKRDAHKAVGELLGVKRNTVKNMRDECTSSEYFGHSA